MYLNIYSYYCLPVDALVGVGSLPWLYPVCHYVQGYVCLSLAVINKGRLVVRPTCCELFHSEENVKVREMPTL